MPGSPSHFLVCRCSQAGLLSEAAVQRAIAVLKEAGVRVTIVPDLCRLAGSPDDPPDCLAGAELLGVVACHERAVKWLMTAAGIARGGREIHCVDIRSGAEEKLDRLLASGSLAEREGQVLELADDGSWIPWFPVIDYERCTSCGQCHSFCLFGAFSRDDDGRVSVTHPQSCKTNCPACARICPEVAIIFPKLEEAPLNGARVEDEEAARARVRVDLRKILGDDPLSALRARAAARPKRRLVDRESLLRAMAERKVCKEKGDRLDSGRDA